MRVQEAFVSDSEVSGYFYIHNETAVKEMLSSEEPLVFTAPDEAEKAAVEEEQDELFPEAVEWITGYRKGRLSLCFSSVSVLGIPGRDDLWIQWKRWGL